MTVVNFEEDAIDGTVPFSAEDTKLSTISDLANKQLVMEARVAQLENDLEDAKEELKQVQERDLPAAMLDVGVTAFQLESGAKITVKPVYLANILPEKKDTAFQWLRSNGHDDLIKNNVILTFGRGEDNQFNTVLLQLRNMGLADHLTHKEEVHWQTLRAFVKEQLEAGNSLPTEDFGVHIINKAQIKRK